MLTCGTSTTADLLQVVNSNDQAVRAYLVAQGLSGNFGFFDQGFTYAEDGDVGIALTGELYEYTGPDPLPFEVAGGTDPAAAPATYSLLKFNAHAALSGRDDGGSHPDKAISYTPGRAPSVVTGSVEDKLKAGTACLKSDFGAVDDPQVDSTQAFNDWWSALMDVNYKRRAAEPDEESYFLQKGPLLKIPNGAFRYDGAGLNISPSDSFIFNVAGESSLSTKIYVPDGVFLFDFDNNPVSATLKDMTFFGGLGAVRYKSTARSVAAQHLFQRLNFSNYTRAALETNSIDLPYYKVRNCMFAGDANSPTVGIAKSGLSAGSHIQANVFLQNRYHIKLGKGDNGVEKNTCLPLDISGGNDFLRLGGRVGATFDIWMVPSENGAQSYRGVNVLDNKFGQENLTAGDAHILFADEQAGATNGERAHATTKSNGFISGLRLEGNNINSENGGSSYPHIKTFTPNVGNMLIRDTYDNGFPEKIIEYDAVITQAEIGNLQRTNVLDVSSFIPGQNGDAPKRLSNLRDVFTLVDPLGYFEGSPEKVSNISTGQYFARTVLFDGPTSGVAKADMTSVAIDNEHGGIGEAAEFTMTAAGGRAVATATGVQSGKLTWVDLEIRRGSANSVNSVKVEILDNAGGLLKRRQVLLDPLNKWQKIRVGIRPNNSNDINVRLTSDEYAASVSTSFRAGNLKVYVSDEPVNTGHTEVYNMSWSGQHVVYHKSGVEYHEWIDASGNARWKIGAPTSDADGVIKSANPAV